MARRGATALSGILAVDKPPGMTSHDVVAAVRRATGERRVGHAGTLDPSATGVLVVLVGPAARLAPYLTAARKAYDARIVFGDETDTDDAEGEVTRTEPVPLALRTEEGSIAHVAALVGTHDQVPPAYSAIKKDGVTAHRAARAGVEMELESRSIEIIDSQLLGVEPGPPVAWNVSLVVSKGTYIRSIARDLGRELGTAAHLDGLRRTASGSVGTADTVTLDQIAAAGPEGVEALFMPAARALELPVLDVDAKVARRVSVGQAVPVPDAAGQAKAHDVVALVHGGRLLGIYRRSDDLLEPATVIPGGVT